MMNDILCIVCILQSLTILSLLYRLNRVHELAQKAQILAEGLHESLMSLSSIKREEDQSQYYDYE